MLNDRASLPHLPPSLCTLAWSPSNQVPTRAWEGAGAGCCPGCRGSDEQLTPRRRGHPGPGPRRRADGLGSGGLCGGLQRPPGAGPWKVLSPEVPWRGNELSQLGLLQPCLPLAVPGPRPLPVSTPWLCQFLPGAGASIRDCPRASMGMWPWECPGVCPGPFTLSPTGPGAPGPASSSLPRGRPGLPFPSPNSCLQETHT